MVNRIRVTETRVLEYQPKLTEDSFYTENNIRTIEDALATDKKEYEEGGITVQELGSDITVSTVWEIVND